MFQNPKSTKNIRNIAHRVTNTHKADQISTACQTQKRAVEGSCYASRIKKGGEVITPQASHTSKGQVYRMRQSIENTCIDGKGFGLGNGSANGAGDGNGSGSGSGDGDGNGDGNGRGDGHGNGYGNGYGYGYGNGNGHGYGNGYGYGYGNGNGEGDGNGKGSG
jgi:hypothetical protein